MPGFAGFDTNLYPGDDVMNWLQANTNLVFTGFYLAPTPSHTDTSWMDKLEFLQENGWGFAPVYVGQEVVGPGSHNASAATGTADGVNAVSLMQRAGFDPGSFVYLDLENGLPFPQALQNYTKAWAAAVTAGGYGVGIYCSHNIAAVAHNLVPHARMWCWNVKTITPHPVPCPYPDPNPSGCGYIGAYGWQLAQNCFLTVPPAPGGILHADVDSALVSDPSAP